MERKVIHLFVRGWQIELCLSQLVYVQFVSFRLVILVLFFRCFTTVLFFR